MAARQQLTEKQKRILVVGLMIHAIVLTFTWRDLLRRPDSAVRGPKPAWAIASALNTMGSLTYWFFGRRPVPVHTLTLAESEAV
jgi:hypothetical protein